MNNEVQELAIHFNPFGWLDLEATCNIGDEVWLSEYDFINDFSGNGSEIYTHSNFMCSSYDYSDNALKELKEKVSPFLNQLMHDKYCNYLFKELELV